MERRDFLKKALFIGGGVGAGLISIPYGIENAIIYPSTELKEKELFSIDISSLEKAVMTSNLLKEKNEKNMIDFHNKIIKKLDMNSKTEKIREKIIRLVIDNSRKFSRKKPSKEKLWELRDEIDSLSYEINELKKDEKIKFIGFKRNTFANIREDTLSFGNSNLRELYQMDNYVCMTESIVKKEKDKEGKLILGGAYNTLQKIAPDASFILEASNISKIPIEEIVTWANVESEGREFAVGREGEINRFQLHPLYLKDIYKEAISQNNALSEYILENTSEKNLLEDSVRNSKLSIALAVNRMLYLKKETSEYYEYILAYNRGLGGTLRLPSRIRKKLENPGKITEKETKYPVFSYYLGYINALKNFRKIRDSIA